MAAPGTVNKALSLASLLFRQPKAGWLSRACQLQLSQLGPSQPAWSSTPPAHDSPIRSQPAAQPHALELLLYSHKPCTVPQSCMGANHPRMQQQHAPTHHTSQLPGTQQQEPQTHMHSFSSPMRSLAASMLAARQHAVPFSARCNHHANTAHPGAQLQPTRGFLNPRQLRDEFFSPDRQITSYLITTNVVLSVMATFNKRMLNALIQNNWLVAQGEYWRLISASFLHGGVLHLLGNMLAVHYLGPPVENVTNRTSFLLIYLSGALSGGLASYHYSFHSTVLGSSGAIAGLFSAWVVYKLRNRDVIPFTQYDTSFVLQMIAINVLISFALSGSIAHMAHIGGLVGGGAAMFLIGPRYVNRNGRVVNQPLLPWFDRLP